jgi:hypothetical protein
VQLRLRPAVALLGILAATALAEWREAPATPLYSARSARTCDNCHVTPNGWVDPQLSERKCTLSCTGCHVDPSGGGMRNASGRFFGRSTIPMIATSPRPTADWDRNAPHVGRRDRATTYTDDLPLGPNDFEASPAYADSVDDRWTFGEPLGGPTRYGLWDGRYGEQVAADPLLAVGVDLRLAALVTGSLVFPMQLDVPVRLHPTHHVTALVNTGVRGRASGYSDTFDSDHSPYFREAYVLLHEAPYQTYVKAGRFVPTFGLRLDDHTSRIRREFELDGALPESRVTGVEVGAAPNYPVVQVSWFRMASRARVPDAWDILDVDEGKGAAVNLGWRDLGWGLGVSGLWRRRPLEEGGDTDTYGVWGAFNPWFYRKSVPLTYQAELDFGTFQRASGIEADKMAFYQELDWLLWNGVNLLVAHDWADPDRDVVDDESHRLQFGGQITPYPGVTLDGRVRALLPSEGGEDADVFLQLHLWY